MTSNRQIALIRGINVGRAKRVAMSDLRTHLEELGFVDVRTLLNSGNVVFTAPARATPKATATKIEAALAEQLGVSARVTVLSAEELSAVVADNPLLDIADDPSRLLVAVLMDPAQRALFEPLTKQEWAPSVFAVSGRFAYLWCAEGILDSRLVAAFNRQLGDAATTRNWSTILKLDALTSNQR